VADEQKKELTVWENCKILFTSSPGYLLVNISNFGDSIAYFGILTLLTRFLGTRIGMSDQLTGMSVSAFTGFVTLFMFGGGLYRTDLGSDGPLIFPVVAYYRKNYVGPAPGVKCLPYSLAWAVCSCKLPVRDHIPSSVCWSERIYR